MIDILSLSVEWIAEKRRRYKKDPAIIEGMIHALYLLECLRITGLDFIFKGGTSLILLMQRPLRFSVDIDIIVSPDMTKAVLEEYLNKIPVTSEFVKVELDERRSYKAGVPKAHYKFIYHSNVPTRTKNGETVLNPEREMLLDVLFSKNPYPILIERPIQTDWVRMTGPALTIKMPDINSIAGDKLVAFAPCTTGVPYGSGKEKEIIKQLFDIGNLFQQIRDFELFKKSYHTSAEGEMRYRPERKIASVEEILKDTVATSLIIARREHFVFEGNFRIDHAQVASAKAAYLAVIILRDHIGRLEIYDKSISINEYLITHPDYNFLNKRLKYIAGGEALFYWYQTIKLLRPE